MEDKINPQIETSEKEKTIGKFSPKRKFLHFVQGRRGGIRFHTDTAFIKSEELTGTIEGAIFKITICDEGINFEETDTNFTTAEMIQRFIDDIDERDVTGYMQKFVVHGLDFRDSDNNRLFLEVEYKKPIDQLFSLFDDLKNEKTDMTENLETDIELSDGAISLLDSLFANEAEEKVESESESITETKVEAPTETYAQQMMREAFEKMNLDKMNELSDRIEKKEKDISKYKLDIRQAEANLKTASEDLGVLYTRLDSLKPIDSPNGHIFYVSPENKTGIVPDQNMVDVVAKIAPILKLRQDVVIDLLTAGYHTIKIAVKGDIENTNIDKEIYEKIKKIDILGKLKMVGPCEFEYRGELTWHKLVDKMIRLGFEQDPDFDKKCGSPSYESEFDKDDQVTQQLNKVSQQISSVATSLPSLSTSTTSTNPDSSESKDFTGQVVREYSDPTTLVVVGEGDYNDYEIQIDDDETGFELYLNKKYHKSYGSMGFIHIYTLDEYKKWYDSVKGTMEDVEGLIGGFVLPNFTGKIEVSALLDDKTFSNKFDISDYIQHQFSGRSVQVVLNIDVNEKDVFDLNDDLSLPVSIIRDIKIDKIIE